MEWQLQLGDKIKGRVSELASFKKIVVRARSNNDRHVPLKLSLISSGAQAFSARVTLDGTFREYEILLNDLKKDRFLLLPRPYPSFLPLWFQPKTEKPFDIKDMEKLEVSFQKQDQPGPETVSGIQIESVWLTK